MLSEEEGSRGLLVAHSRHCRAAVIYTSRSLKIGDEMLGLEPRQPEEPRQPVCTAYHICRSGKEVLAPLLHSSCRHWLYIWPMEVSGHQGKPSHQKVRVGRVQIHKAVLQ